MDGSKSRATDQLLAELVAWAQVQPEILAVYLYGSQAEGRAGALSDVDVAILAQAGLSRQQLWELEDRCAARWPDPLDTRVLNLAPLPFRYEVTARGRCLWAADRGLVAEQESLTWRAYWDLRPYLERDWQHFVEHVMEQKNETEREQYQTALAQIRAVHRRVTKAAAGSTGDISE